MKIAIVSSYTIRLLTQRFKNALQKSRIDNVEIFDSEYNFFGELLSPGSKIHNIEDLDFIFLFVRYEDIPEVSTLVEHLTRLKDQVAATIITTNFLFQETTNLYDANIIQSSRDNFLANQALLKKETAGLTNCYILDLEGIARNLGHQNFFDHRLWYMSMYPFSNEATQRICANMIRMIRATKTGRKKCIVLDCDNTLWGGIIGEDGINGIKLGPDYPGNCYVTFQVQIKKMADLGYILAINSKNNEADVLEVLEQHPSQILKKADFICRKINWSNKVQNMINIAEELNVGTNSLIFFDDNPVEIEMISRSMPEIECVRVPRNPLQIVNIINTTSLVDILVLTEEDKKKSRMYSENIKRDQQKNAFTDIREYLQDLDMKMTIYKNESSFVQRMAQMTQKTNQFNVLTQRRNEDDIVNFLEKSDIVLYVFSLNDKFGDNGVVGYCEVEIKNSEAQFNNFLISCRVVGREAEHMFLTQILNDLKEHHEVTGTCAQWVETKKNSLCENFFSDYGFSLIENDSQNHCRKYTFDLSKFSSEITHKKFFEVSWS